MFVILFSAANNFEHATPKHFATCIRLRVLIVVIFDMFLPDLFSKLDRNSPITYSLYPILRNAPKLLKSRNDFFINFILFIYRWIKLKLHCSIINFIIYSSLNCFGS